MSIVLVLDTLPEAEMWATLKEEPIPPDPLEIQTTLKVKSEPAEPGSSQSSPMAGTMKETYIFAGKARHE